MGRFVPQIDKNKFPWDRDIYTGREIVSVIEQISEEDIDYQDIRKYTEPLVSAGEIRKIGARVVGEGKEKRLGNARQVRWNGMHYRLYSIRNHDRYLNQEAWVLHIHDYLAPHQRKGILGPGNRLSGHKTK